MISNKKSLMLLVLKVLEEYTDEEHYLTQQEIIRLIEEQYGLEFERKSIASSLNLLEELDYDIEKGPKGGYALLSRLFDPTEASYLIDALFSSRSISGSQAKHIAETISKTLSKYQRKDYSYIVKSTELHRTNNQQVLYNISIIHEAMEKGKRVGFQYISYDKEGNKVARKDGWQYIVSPYYLINNFGRYYLLCNFREKYQALQTFRIDYMMNIEIKEDWNIKKMSDLKNGPKDFSVVEYLNEHVYLFSGNVITATLELENESAITNTMDWFGEDINIYTKDGKTLVKIKCDENALYYWVLQYMNEVKVIAPISFVEKVKKGLKEALHKYEDNEKVEC